MSEQDTATPEAAEAAQPVITEPPAETATEPKQDGQPDAWDPTRAQDKIRKQNQENAALRAAKKAAEEAASTAADRAKDLEQTAARVPDLEQQLLRTEIALEFGIPAKIAKRLIGSTREAIIADAEELLAEMAPKAKSPRPVESLRPAGGAAPEQPTLADQIAAAQAAGNWAAAIALKSKQLEELSKTTP